MCVRVYILIYIFMGGREVTEKLFLDVQRIDLKFRLVWPYMYVHTGVYDIII